MSRHFLMGFGTLNMTNLRRDIVAALVVAAISIPESLGFAAVAGLPLVSGLYAGLLAPIVFALFTSSRRLIIGADSATAALVAAGALSVAAAGSSAYINAASVIGILVAIILIAMALLKFGFLADLISTPVLVGFFAGIGVQLILMKIPDVLGIIADGTTYQRLGEAMYHLPNFNSFAVLITLTVIGVTYIVGKQKVPGMLIGLIAASGIATAFRLEEYGLTMIGALPAGLPPLAWPQVTTDMLITLLPFAFMIALVIIAQSLVTIRSIASDHDEKVFINRDINALGLANAASALSGGFVVNGSPPRSLAADNAGGHSQMVNVFVALIIGACLVYAPQLFAYIPAAALAAIVMIVGFHMIRVRELRQIYAVSKIEFVIALVAFLGVSIFGVSQGILIAVAIALMERLHRQYRPHSQVLLRDGELTKWARERIDTRHEGVLPSDIIVYSFSGSLFFENVRYFEEQVIAAVETAKTPVSYVLIDAGAIDDIDYTAVETLRHLYQTLAEQDVQLGFAHVTPNLREQFRRFGIIDIVGPKNIFSTLHDAIDSHTSIGKNPKEIIRELDLAADSYVVIGGAVLSAKKIRKTHNLDLVVSDAVYRKFRDEHAWKEYVQDNGKQILAYHGCHMMRRWMGFTLPRLLNDAFVVDGIKYMSLTKLVAGKKRLGRKKDLDDIRLITEYLSTKRGVS